MPLRAEEGRQPGLSRAWRHGLFAVALSIIWVLAWHWNTVGAMVAIWWRSETFAHGFLVPVISAWLVWRDRARVLAQTPRAMPWMLLLQLAAGLAWLLGELGTVNSLSQLALVTMIVLLVPLLLGLQVTRALLFPLLFLFFAVPMGEFLLPTLMSSTADFTVSALRLTGIPVFREGQHLVIPSGHWSVVEACSGIRYLIASVMVGTLYAYLSYRSLVRRLVFVAVSAVVPLVANWMRAYLIVMLGHLSDNRLATGVDHIIYGWLFFGIVMALMFWVGSLWHEDPRDAVDPPHRGLSVPVPAGGALRMGGALVALFVVATVPVLWQQAIQGQALRSGPTRVAPLAQVPGWTSSENWATSWKPRFQLASDEVFRTYRRGGQEVGLYLGYYENQNSERKLVSSENVLVATADKVWSRVSRGESTVPYVDGPLKVSTGDLLNMGVDERLLAWQWYWIGGHLTSSEVMGKAYVALMRLLGKGDDAAAVIVYARQGKPGEAEMALSSFVKDAGPAIEQALEMTRKRQ
ncbi:MAG: exosortase A [Rhodocyclaceae bacterium]|nr:exosortase A [Rhodocyclaceae bacterium]